LPLLKKFVRILTAISGEPRQRVLLRRLVIIVHDMPFWKHSPVQNAANQNSFRLLTVEHNVLFALHSMQAATNIITASTQRRIIGQHPATRLESVEVSEGLSFAPVPRRMLTDP
jgi:hypothetical protein